MLRVWLDIPVDASGRALAGHLARRHPAFALVGISTGGETAGAAAEVMMAQSELFDVVTAGPLTGLAGLVERYPEARARWRHVVCAAGQLEWPAEANIAADPAAAEVVLKHTSPRLVGLEASRGLSPAEERVSAPLALLSLLHPEAFDLQRLRVRVERDGRLRLTDDGYLVEYALHVDWPVLELELAEALGLPR